MSFGPETSYSTTLCPLLTYDTITVTAACPPPRHRGETVKCTESISDTQREAGSPCLLAITRNAV